MESNINGARLRAILAHIGQAPGNIEPRPETGPEGEPLLPPAAALRKHLSPDQWHAVGKLMDGHTIPEKYLADLYRVVVPIGRPAMIVEGGDFTAQPPWTHFGADPVHANLRHALRAVGLIALPGYLVQPLAGTGFLVGERLVMTNRHVAEVFARGLDTATPTLRPGVTPVIDFRRERIAMPGDTGGRYAIEAVLPLHTDWDIALLRLDRAPAGIAPLILARTLPGGARRDIAVLGYPGRPETPKPVEQDIFQDLYNVKRVSPGQLGPFEQLGGTNLRVLTHDGSTLPGSSGSPVLDVQTGYVIGVHFDGKDLHANYLVPSDALAQDQALVAAGVQFTA